MKKFSLILAVICAITFAVNAQNTKTTTPAKTTTTKTTPAGQQKAVKETPEQKAKTAVDKLDKEVTLTADQKTKVTDLAVTRFKSVDAIREKYKGQADKKDTEKTEIQAALKDYREGLKTILTADQIKKMEDAEKAAKANANGGQQKTTPTEKKTTQPEKKK